MRWAVPVLLVVVGWAGVVVADWEVWLDDVALLGRVAALRRTMRPGGVEGFRRFVEGFELGVETAPMGGGRLEECGVRDVPGFFRKEGLRHRRLEFPSLREGEGGAVFYLCGSEEAWRRMDRAVLWVPGMGFSRPAFRFIRPFWEAAVGEGWLLMVYVPPLHLDRLPRGRREGEGFFTGDPEHDIRRVAECVRELRSGLAWLRSCGVGRVGGWGGSMGAAMVLLVSRYEALDHVAVMIPVLDWRALWLEHPVFRPLREELRSAGYDEELLRRGYGLVSPAEGGVGVRGDRMQVLVAAKDRLNPARRVLRLSSEWGVAEVRIYPRSHGTVLLERRMFRDYAAFLRRMGSDVPR